VDVVFSELTGFTRCMRCDPADEHFPTDQLYLEYYNINYLTPRRLHTLCSISTQRKALLSKFLGKNNGLDTPTSQTDGQTDGRTTSDSNTALALRIAVVLRLCGPLYTIESNVSFASESQ